MKVRYDGKNCAYLDDEPDDQGVYHGVNRYTDEPVSLRWDGESWVAPAASPVTAEANNAEEEK